MWRNLEELENQSPAMAKYSVASINNERGMRSENEENRVRKKESEQRDRKLFAFALIGRAGPGETQRYTTSRCASLSLSLSHSLGYPRGVAEARPGIYIYVSVLYT